MRRASALAALFAAQLAAALLCQVEGHSDAVTQSIAWFASGTGLAGVWLLGSPAALVVGAATLTQRVAFGYHAGLAAIEAIGSGLEATFGAWLLVRCGLRAACARLRDVGALAIAASITPFVSIATASLARWLNPAAAEQIGMFSGWIGWWRMNALGAIAIVPVVLTCHARAQRPWQLRTLLDAAATIAGAGVLLAGVAFVATPSLTSLTALHAVLAVALVAALRQGPTGASAVAALGAVFVTLATQHGHGPFMSVPFAERHAAAQVFLLTLVSVALVFGALVATRRELEDRLRQAQRLEAVGLLAGGLAHDFNNLLTVVRGNAEALRDEAAPGSAAREQAVEVVDASIRGANLTRQLLAFSRQQIQTPEVLDCGAVVAALAGMLRRLLRADIDLRIERLEPAWVRADRGQIEQVVMNLVINARDAMPTGGTLTVATGVVELSRAVAAAIEVPPGRYAELSVRDTGQGMAPEVRAHAFEPFFTTKHAGQGTGLGLATVHGIVRQSGGGVAIDSAPGAGTTLRVWLPAVPPAPHADAAPPAPIETPRAASILVAEDERGVRAMLCQVLTAAGHRVVLAEHGAEAVARATALGPFDLLVTDLVMPGIGGNELARQLCAAAPTLGVLFVSAHARGDARVDLDEFANADFLSKPFATEDLLGRIGGLLARRR